MTQSLTNATATTALKTASSKTPAAATLILASSSAAVPRPQAAWQEPQRIPSGNQDSYHSGGEKTVRGRQSQRRQLFFDRAPILIQYIVGDAGGKVSSAKEIQVQIV